MSLAKNLIHLQKRYKMRLSRVYFKIIAVVLVFKIVFLAIGLIAISALPYSKSNYEINFHFPDNETKMIAHLKTWDAQHYLFLAEKGYEKGRESNRFFPLYPILIKIFSFVFQSKLLTAHLLSLALTIGSAILLHKLVKLLSFTSKTYWLSLFLLLSFPTAFFLHLPYSESLFLFICLCYFYAYEKKNNLLQFLTAFLLPLTRPTGILIMLPVLVSVSKGLRNKKVISIPTFNMPIKIPFTYLYLMTLAPLIGIACYFLFHKIVTGNFFTGIIGINSVSTWNAINVLDPGSLIRNLLSTNLVLHGFQNSILDRIFFVLFLVISFLIYKKLPKNYFFFSLVLGLVPLLGSFTSYMRYILPIFPIYIVMSLLIQETKSKALQYTVLVSFISIQVILYTLHILNYWVS